MLTDFIREISNDINAHAASNVKAGRRLRSVLPFHAPDSFQGFLGDMLGGKWSDLVPSGWSKPSECLRRCLRFPRSASGAGAAY